MIKIYKVIVVKTNHYKLLANKHINELTKNVINLINKRSIIPFDHQTTSLGRLRPVSSLL